MQVRDSNKNDRGDWFDVKGLLGPRFPGTTIWVKGGIVTALARLTWQDGFLHGPGGGENGDVASGRGSLIVNWKGSMTQLCHSLHVSNINRVSQTPTFNHESDGGLSYRRDW